MCVVVVIASFFLLILRLFTLTHLQYVGHKAANRTRTPGVGAYDQQQQHIVHGTTTAFVYALKPRSESCHQIFRKINEQVCAASVDFFKC